MPTPRTEQQIIGDQIAAFLSRYGIGALKAGGPILSLIEAASGSDFRASKDIFDFLKAISLDNSEGTSLDRIGNSDNVKRIAETIASGIITITDSTFIKIQTKIYQGTPAPIVGSTIIYVLDASNFTTPGPNTYLYLGRGTSNYEGPIRYTTLINLGPYWSIALATGTLRFHNLGESVILAQGGKRTITAGTVCQTPQGPSSDPVQFSTLYPAYILDGETKLEGVTVLAKTPGVAGNVISGAISAFSPAPFTGATVTNPLPITNGRPAEKDSDYRERIKKARQSKSRGTSIACQFFAVGAQAQDENSIVTAASFVKSVNLPSTLYIDDGTGYEEKSTGVAIESLTDRALGGEQDFQVTNRPISKAFLSTSVFAPYTLVDGCELAFSVGGVTTTHSFDAEGFYNIAAATAYEIVASINANIYLGWGARLIESGTKVAVFSKADFNEAIEVISISLPGIDANTWLEFSQGKVDSLSLFIDDNPLSKDGELATLASFPFGIWGAISGSPTLSIIVDRTPVLNVTFVDQDFIDAKTGYIAVGNNSPEAWATVIEMKVPGISCTVSQSQLILSSNRGYSSRASLEITGGSLVTDKVFILSSSTGKIQDYILDRNTGQIRLVIPLEVGMKLSVGTKYIRSFLESGTLGTVSIPAPNPANLWFSVDGKAERIPVGVSTASVYDISVTAIGPWGHRLKIIDIDSTKTPFTNVEEGDQLVVWDSSFDVSLTKKSWRISGTSTHFVNIDRPVMNVARCGHTATVLLDGTILLVGGYTAWNQTAGTEICEIFDPSTNGFTVVGSMGSPRAFHTATILPSGKVLVVGGIQDNAAATAMKTCEIYDPVAQTWSAAASLPAGQERYGHGAGYLAGATNLTLIAGGFNTSGTALATCYLYDDGANTWTATGVFTARAQFMMVVSSDNVVVAGGLISSVAVTNSAQRYNPGAGTWAATGGGGVIAEARHSGLAVLNSAGDAWIFGGNQSSPGITLSKKLDVYSFGGDSWATPGDPSTAVAFGVGGLFTNTKVFSAFGLRSNYSDQATDWVGGVWSSIGSQPLGGTYPRKWAAGAVIGNLFYVFGGVDAVVGTPSSSVEIWNDTGGAWSQPDPAIGTNIAATQGGLTVVRATDKIQQLTIPCATGYTSTSLAPLFSTLKGIEGSAYRPNKLRVNTSSYDVAGDVALVAQDIPSLSISLTPSDAVSNHNVHVASVEAGNEEANTPSFYGTEIRGQISLDRPILVSTDPIYDALVVSSILKVSRSFYPSLAIHREGNNQGFRSSIAAFGDITDSSIETIFVLNEAPQVGWMPGDRGYISSPYAIGPNDDLIVQIDKDSDTKNFYTKMYRNLATVGSYGSIITVTDADASLGLQNTFGYGSDGFYFNDFAVYMKARIKTHSGDATKRALWRFNRFGFEGTYNKVHYELPLSPNQALSVGVDNTIDKYTYIKLILGSGVQRALNSVYSTSKVGVAVTTKDSNGTATVQYIFGYLVSSAQRDGAGAVTLTLTLPVDAQGGAVANHGLVNGNTIYLNSSDLNFPSGAYSITNVPGPTQIVYNDGGGVVGATPNIGDVTFDDLQVSLSGAGVIAGDFFYFNSTTGVPASIGYPTKRISVYSSIRIEGVVPACGLGINTTTIFCSVLAPNTGFAIFANLAQSATAIVAAVNSLAAVLDSTCPITGTITGTGAGVISQATYEEKDDGVNYNGILWYQLADGLNLVRGTIIPPNLGTNYQLLLKMPITASLVTNSDWTNEILRIVPLTAKNIVDWFNAPCVSGLSSVATIEASSRGTKPQISSLTPGSVGTVEVQGGLANLATAPVVDQSFLIAGAYPVVSIKNEDTIGFSGGMWISIDNTSSLPKNVITSTTALLSIVPTSSGATFTFNIVPVWSAVAGCAINNTYLQIEKQGKFVGYIDTGLGVPWTPSSASEGDWLYVTSPTTPGTGFDISGANIGLYRIVAKTILPDGRNIVFVENDSAIESSLAACDVKIIAAGSVLPGDKFSINTPLWGAKGIWTVTSVGVHLGKQFVTGYEYTFTVAPDPAIVAISYPGPGQALGAEYVLAQVIEEKPLRLIKRILSIVLNQIDGSWADIKLHSLFGWESISENGGSIITALGKLAFPTGIFQGEDGYRYNTGLIQEVNKILYGDPANPSSYPGVAADGARINVAGPLIKRIKISILIRTQSTETQLIADKVKAAIAALINKTPFGVSIALSDVLKAAGKVYGVKSVVLLSPIMSSASDLISVRPFESPRILNVDQDISVSFVG